MKLNLREVHDFPSGMSVERQVADYLKDARSVLQHVRSLALDLRPSLLDELGLVPAMRWYVGRQAERAGWAVEFCADGIIERPSPNVEVSMAFA